jgi:hypothetical protein
MAVLKPPKGSPDIAIDVNVDVDVALAFLHQLGVQRFKVSKVCIRQESLVVKLTVKDAMDAVNTAFHNFDRRRHLGTVLRVNRHQVSRLHCCNFFLPLAQNTWQQTVSATIQQTAPRLVFFLKHRACRVRPQKFH